MTYTDQIKTHPTEVTIHPLSGLKVAPSYGLHSDPYKSGRCGFVGTIPAALHGKSFDSEDEAVKAANEAGWHCATLEVA